MKNQEKAKELLNDADVGNVEQWTQMSSVWFAAKLNPSDTFNCQIWGVVIVMESPKELVQ